MSRLNSYRSAMLAAFPELSNDALHDELEAGGSRLIRQIIDFGLGPLWHHRTGRREFHDTRMVAESLYLAQEQAIREFDQALTDAEVKYAVIKGAADRHVLYDNPALRACHDIDILVHHDVRVAVARKFIDLGYAAKADPNTIGHEIQLHKGPISIDLHWGLLREGRLRSSPIENMLLRRQRVHDFWALDTQDMLFLQLVHSAFTKHLAAWQTGLHRVLDVLRALKLETVDWNCVESLLSSNGVRTAAWATLHWVQLLSLPHSNQQLESLINNVEPGQLRRAWLSWWLSNDLSQRTECARSVRLIGFSQLLHDSPRDVARVISGRRQALRRSSGDASEFSELFDN